MVPFLIIFLGEFCVTIYNIIFHKARFSIPCKNNKIYPLLLFLLHNSVNKNYLTPANLSKANTTRSLTSSL